MLIVGSRVSAGIIDVTTQLSRLTAVNMTYLLYATKQLVQPGALSVL